MTQAQTTASYPTRGGGRPSSTLHYVVGEMNGKLDQLMATLIPQLSALRDTDSDHNRRIQKLEVWQARILGGGAVVLFLITSSEVIRYVILKH